MRKTKRLSKAYGIVIAIACGCLAAFYLLTGQYDIGAVAGAMAVLAAILA